jgi:ribosomal protein S18 acetylase RimI-like enzyme
VDADVIAQLHADSWRSAYRGVLSDDYLEGLVVAERLALWRKRLHTSAASDQYVVVADRDRRPVGFVCAYARHDDTWGTHLDNLHVMPQLRGQRIGAALMRVAAQWSSSVAPGDGLFLWVVEQNLPARRFYESLGGIASGDDVWAAPDGGSVPIVRYVWQDVPVLSELAVQRTAQPVASK